MQTLTTASQSISRASQKSFITLADIWLMHAGSWLSHIFAIMCLNNTAALRTSNELKQHFAIHPNHCFLTDGHNQSYKRIAKILFAWRITTNKNIYY